MVGEDHSVSTVIKEKDAEIAELRRRVEMQEEMLRRILDAVEGTSGGPAMYRRATPQNDGSRTR